jgi:hypothetical protein
LTAVTAHVGAADEADMARRVAHLEALARGDALLPVGGDAVEYAGRDVCAAPARWPHASGMAPYAGRAVGMLRLRHMVFESFETWSVPEWEVHAFGRNLSALDKAAFISLKHQKRFKRK